MEEYFNILSKRGLNIEYFYETTEYSNYFFVSSEKTKEIEMLKREYEKLEEIMSTKIISCEEDDKDLKEEINYITKIMEKNIREIVEIRNCKRNSKTGGKNSFL